MTAGCLDVEKKTNLAMLIRWFWMWKKELMMQCSSLCQQSSLFVTRGAVVLLQTKEGVDSGSETDNEQMEVPEEAAAAAESLKNNNSPSKPGAVPLQQNEEEDYASDGSSDILQPTQVSSSSMAVAASVLFLR